MTQRTIDTGLNVHELYAETVELMNRRGQDATFRDDYSGRFMYGQTTVGIVTREGGAAIGAAMTRVLMKNLPDLDDSEFEELLQTVLPKRTDSMGLSTIFYL